MKKLEWHKGPPPHAGWWNARTPYSDDENWWGWWDGQIWSTFVSNYSHPRTAGEAARDRGGMQVDKILWTTYYPENARVPRVDPHNATPLPGISE